MKTLPLATLALASTAMCGSLICGSSFAQNPAPAGAFPSRSITVVHPQATGGPVDITTRLIAQKAAEGLGQTLVVEARPGAGGALSGPT